jgi:hypothetical protein
MAKQAERTDFPNLKFGRTVVEQFRVAALGIRLPNFSVPPRTAGQPVS